MRAIPYLLVFYYFLQKTDGGRGLASVVTNADALNAIAIFCSAKAGILFVGWAAAEWRAARAE